MFRHLISSPEPTVTVSWWSLKLRMFLKDPGRPRGSGWTPECNSLTHARLLPPHRSAPSPRADPIQERVQVRDQERQRVSSPGVRSRQQVPHLPWRVQACFGRCLRSLRLPRSAVCLRQGDLIEVHDRHARGDGNVLWSSAELRRGTALQSKNVCARALPCSPLLSLSF